MKRNIQLLPSSLRMIVGTEQNVLLSLAETAAVSWRLLSLVTDCSKLEMLPLEMPVSDAERRHGNMLVDGEMIRLSSI